MMIRRFTALLLSLLMLPVFTSCVKVSAKELSAGYSPSDNAMTGAYIEGPYVRFTSALFKGAAENGGNVLVSPYSALICFSMLANGADGESRAEIENYLGCDTEQLEKLSAYLISSLKTGKECVIKTANSVWVKDSFEKSVLPSYLQKNADVYGAQIYSAPFDQSTVKDVNLWCDRQTDGMIDKIIDNVRGDEVFFLINSLLFDAKWETKYEKKDIKDGEFRNYNGTEKSVKMLNSTERFVPGETYSGFSKKYKDGNYVFTAILPDDESTDIFKFIKDLDVEELFKTEYNGSVEVFIPEFSFDGEADFREILKKEGITSVFDPGAADLSLISRDQLYCSAFIQKTRVELDRNGTKAAAISLIGGAKSAAPSENRLIFDRPFVFTISDAKDGFPLFIGTVTRL